MKITFLGTGHGVPSAIRACSSTLLEIGDAHYLIDGGAPVAERLTALGVRFDSVRALFNTHFHSDHILGALQFFALCNWYYKTSDLRIFLPEEAGMNAIKGLINTTGTPVDESRLHFETFGADFTYRDENLSLGVIPTRHMAEKNRPSYAFRIEAEGKRVMFTGDLTKDLSDLPEVLTKEDFDLLVIENAHCPTELLLEKLNTVRASRVAVNHVNKEAVKFPMLEAAVGHTPYELIVVKDWDELTV